MPKNVMLNLFQHLFQDLRFQNLYKLILNQVQGDNTVFSQQILSRLFSPPGSHALRGNPCGVRWFVR